MFAAVFFCVSGSFCFAVFLFLLFFYLLLPGWCYCLCFFKFVRFCVAEARGRSVSEDHRVDPENFFDFDQHCNECVVY